MSIDLPLVVEAEQLAAVIDDPELLILDLSALDHYNESHIPGAIHVDNARLLLGQPPVPNKMPTAQQLSELFSELGLTQSTHVVVYDDQKGPWAGRMIWTLHCVGHTRTSFLNGQLDAWKEAEQPVETKPNFREPTTFEAHIDRSLVADVDYIKGQLDNPNFRVWDARTQAEYEGLKITNAKRGGHIPGAKLFEWTDAFNAGPLPLLRDPAALKAALANVDIHPSNEIVTHCQTHRRSGLTYIVARYLGFKHIRCYDGSWFEWGNREDTPIESEHRKTDANGDA